MSYTMGYGIPFVYLAPLQAGAPGLLALLRVDAGPFAHGGGRR